MVVGNIINSSNTIGMILDAGTQNLTGLMVATMFLLLMFFITLMIMFKVPLEVMALLLLPFVLAVATFYSSFMIVLVAFIIFLSMMLAKNWLFR